MILGGDKKMVDGNMTDDKEDLGWRKQQKYVKRCKDAVGRLQREYVTVLRERQNMQHKCKAVDIDVEVM